MSEIAVRDTTFDNVKLESVWISHRTTPDGKYIVCFLVLNGIEKEISRFYVHDYDGLICESTNLTWILS